MYPNNNTSSLFSVQQVMVAQPTVVDTISILRGLKEKVKYLHTRSHRPSPCCPLLGCCFLFLLLSFLSFLHSLFPCLLFCFFMSIVRSASWGSYHWRCIGSRCYSLSSLHFRTFLTRQRYVRKRLLSYVDLGMMKSYIWHDIPFFSPIVILLSWWLKYPLSLLPTLLCYPLSSLHLRMYIVFYPVFYPT